MPPSNDDEVRSASTPEECLIQGCLMVCCSPLFLASWTFAQHIERVKNQSNNAETGGDADIETEVPTHGTSTKFHKQALKLCRSPSFVLSIIGFVFGVVCSIVAARYLFVSETTLVSSQKATDALDFVRRAGVVAACMWGLTWVGASVMSPAVQLFGWQGNHMRNNIFVLVCLLPFLAGGFLCSLLFGLCWLPVQSKFGISWLCVGTLGLALLILGLFCAILMHKFSKPRSAATESVNQPLLTEDSEAQYHLTPNDVKLEPQRGSRFSGRSDMYRDSCELGTIPGGLTVSIPSSRRKTDSDHTPKSSRSTSQQNSIYSSPAASPRSLLSDSSPRSSGKLHSPLDSPATSPRALHFRNLHRSMPQFPTKSTCLHPVILFSGFRTSDKGEGDGYTPQTKKALEQIVLLLGGDVAVEQKGSIDFDERVTHVVAPPSARTIKALAAVLTGRWVMPSSWLEHSKTAGYFVAETLHGHMRAHSPLLDQHFFLTDIFRSKVQRYDNAKVVLSIGKAIVVPELEQANFIIYGNGDDTVALKASSPAASLMTWHNLICFIYPFHEDSKVTF